MELKSEKSFVEFLKTLPDDDIIKYYLDVEFTPFPVLVIDEYNRRFKTKTKEQIIKDLKFQARLARRKTKEFALMAKKQKLVNDVSRQKTQKIITQAKKKGYKISESLLKKGTILQSKMKTGAQKGIKAGKQLKPSPAKDLEVLEKLAKLQKAGIITEKEFKAKKKKILSKI